MRASVSVLFAIVCSVHALNAAEAPEFARDVKPILERHCAGCHSGASAQASLDVRSLGSLMKGGVSGAAIVAGSAERSPLYQRVSSGQMPPTGALAKEYVTILRKWIESGARSEEPDAAADATNRPHWAFQAPARPAVPRPRANGRVRTPIDALVLAQLEKRGLSLSPDAAAVTLIRRVTFDLTGLPPTPEQIDRFLAKRSPAAYEQYVDELLASPQYGERWARHLARCGGLCRF